MRSLKNGKNISPVEITHISKHGFWLLINGKEYFLTYEKYPWFKDASLTEITDVKLLHNHHLYWPSLDVDLTTEILASPEKYPLTYAVDGKSCPCCVKETPRKKYTRKK
jgi:hypothetical protein